MFSKIVVVGLVAASLGFSMTKQRLLNLRREFQSALSIDTTRKLCTDRQLTYLLHLNRYTQTYTKEIDNLFTKCLPESHKVLAKTFKELGWRKHD
jgi:hypothetical protein